MGRRLPLAAATALSVWLAAPTAPAGETRLFAGYDFTRQQANSQRDAQTRHGVSGAIDRDVYGRLGLKAGFSYGSRRSADVRRSHTLIVGGPVFHALRTDRLGVFLHALGGVTRRFEELDAFDVRLSRSSTDPTLLLGGGVDVWWKEQVAFRAQAGYVLGGSAEDLGRLRAVHASIGLALRFGER